MAKLKITQSSSITNVTYPKPIGDRYVNPDLIGGAHIGGTGGLTSQTGFQIQPAVYVFTSNGASSNATGSILAQKGQHRFRVTDGTYTGDCRLANAPQANLTAGSMSITINTNQLTSANLTATTGSATTFAYVTFGTANVAGINSTAIAAGTSSALVQQYLTGTGLVGNVTVTSYSAAGGLGNANVSFSSQTVSNIAGTGTFNTSLYASRITNKFVYDFGSDGQIDSTNGITTYYTSGYNPNKYKYRLAAPNSTYVQVASA